MRICWTDDKIDEAQAFAVALRPLNAEISFYADGEAALAAMSTQWFDVVIVDLQMPPGEWGGLWLLEQLKSRRHGPVAIVLSGEGTQQETIEAMRLGAVDYVRKVAATAELADRLLALSRTQLLRLVESEESERLEFKETLRWNERTGASDKRLEHAALKTIAAFSNSEGGVLIIGRHDDGTVVGIDRDLATVKGKDVDGFELHLRNLITATMGVAVNHLVVVAFDEVDERLVAVIRVEPATRPAYLSAQEGKHFYVRVGNSTRSLDVEETPRYIAGHWPSA